MYMCTHVQIAQARILLHRRANIIKPVALMEVEIIILIIGGETLHVLVTFMAW